MAHIDDLVRRVSDPQLRQALMEQVRTLVDRKEFGLVFQQHLPETVQLPRQLIRAGDKVQLRSEKAGTTFRVISVEPVLHTLTVVTLDESGEPDGPPVEMPVDDLVVVKEFGEPIYPGLRRVAEAGTPAQGQPDHVVINAENFHALQALEYTHGNKVDLIYIDPPYNTGAADWKYNDRYVDSGDAYRHSKWLSFLQRRLRIAKRLLKQTGVIILAVDDNEHHRLRMLADQVFGEDNFLANLTWQGRGKNDRRFTGGGADYMLVYAASRASLVDSDARWKEEKPGAHEMLVVAREGYESALAGGANAEESALAATKALRAFVRKNTADLPGGLRQYNTVDAHGRVFREGPMDSPNYRANLVYPLVHPKTGGEIPSPKKGWRVSREAMQALIERDEIAFGADERKVPQKKLFLEEKNIQVPAPTFTAERDVATKWLEDILGDKRFPFPKNHEVLMRWFRMLAPSNAVILDFFGGSGTTAEAVIRLNMEDNGTRQCLLVTNNEVSKSEDAELRRRNERPGDEAYEALGVFHHVAKPRLATILTGIREDGSRYSEGIEGQRAMFFDLTYEDENLISLGRRFEAIAPLLWMQAGAVGPIIDKVDPAGFSAPRDGIYAVIFDTGSAAEAVDALHDGVGTVFIVTDSEAEFRMVAGGLPRRLQGTAQHLYASYLRSFEINRT